LRRFVFFNSVEERANHDVAEDMSNPTSKSLSSNPLTTEGQATPKIMSLPSQVELECQQEHERKGPVKSMTALTTLRAFHSVYRSIQRLCLFSPRFRIPPIPASIDPHQATRRNY
jgi:hypothetical protein